MAFETAHHSPPSFFRLSPARRAFAAIALLAALAALAWCCDVAYHAKPVPRAAPDFQD
jgi:hypothetical protein